VANDEFVDYYQVLRIPETATYPEIEKAYLFEMRYWHPDNYSHHKDSDKAKAQGIAVSLNQAHEILTDPERRALYDELRREWQAYQLEANKERYVFENSYKLIKQLVECVTQYEELGSLGLQLLEAGLDEHRVSQVVASIESSFEREDHVNGSDHISITFDIGESAEHLAFLDEGDITLGPISTLLSLWF
jgi:curved DNA-binding protein CbpA